MKLLSVNVSLPKQVPYNGKIITTGIFKEPVSGRVLVHTLNVQGDGQADRKVHGGRDMAVYAYPFEHYEFWEETLGRSEFPFGQFGENLTVEGLAEGDVRVGDSFRVGGTLLQVTQPRIPCYKLALRMGEGTDFPKRFQDSGRLGFYLRVIEEGEIGAGDAIERVDTDGGSVTIAEFIHIYLHETHDPDSLRRVLVSRDLGDAWRIYLERMLEKAELKPSPSGWEGYRTFVVDRKVPESETITSFYLVPEDGGPLPPFKPGQFLTFRLDIPDQSKPITRTYTISDRPDAGYYRVSIKRETPPAHRPDAPPGLSSNYFHDHVRPGVKLCVKAPRGEFWLDPGDDTPVVLVSAGVGLTPLISMLNGIVAAGSRRPVWFIHGARGGREHAMGEHVRRLAAEHDNVHLHVRYSRPEPGDIEGQNHGGITSWLRNMPNLSVYEGHGRFAGPDTVRVNGALLQAARIFINTGARADIPAIPGLDQVDYLTNSSMMDVDYLPEHLVIIGGSYIGLEFAQMYRRFGSRVTIIENGERLINRDDEDVSEAVKEILRNEAIEIRLNAECLSVEKRGEQVAVHAQCKGSDPEVVGSHLLLAVGRRPNTDDLGLEAAGIETDMRGFIVVDDQLQTNVPGIWALGDVNGRGAFTHTSYNDYEIVAANLFDNDPRRVSNRIPAYALYIDPPLGRAGMTEQQVRETGRKALIGKMMMTRIGRARERSETQGFMKVLIDAETEKILGAAILGIGGDEIIHSILDVMYADAPYTMIQRAMHIHPTVTELIPTMLGDLNVFE